MTVRTKPTARKSTGGKAPRNRLSFKASHNASKVSKPQRRPHGLVTSSGAAGQPGPQQADLDHIDEIHNCLRHAVSAEEAREQIWLSDEALTKKHVRDSANLFSGATLVRARLKKMRTEIEEKTKKVQQLEARLVTERTENEDRIGSAERDFEAKLHAAVEDYKQRVDSLEASHQEKQEKAVESFKSSVQFEGLQFEQFCLGYMLCRDEIWKKNPHWDLAFLAEETVPDDGKKGGASY